MSDFPTKVQDCDKCRAHYFANPSIIHAFASVGIEHGKSTWQMAEEYYERFHRAKHSEGRGEDRYQPPSGGFFGNWGW